MVDYEKLLKTLNELPWRGILVIVALAFILASVVSNVFSFLLIPKAPPAVPISSSQVVDSLPSGSLTITDSDIQKICDRNLFNKDEKCPGVDEKPDTEDDKVGPEVVKSDLPVKIVGIIYGGTPYNGLATVLNTQANKINSFIVGDRLLNDAIVDEILRTRIIIKRQGGRREYIELEQQEILRSKRGRAKSPSTSPLNTVAPIAEGPPPKNFSEEGFERVGNDMKMSQQYKEQLLNPESFAKVLQDAKATPNIVDGQIRGFRLTRIREGSVYQKAGFQNDDVVEEINGEPLTNVAAAIRLLQSLRNESQVEVMVNRGGSSFPMTLTVQQ